MLKFSQSQPAFDFVRLQVFLSTRMSLNVGPQCFPSSSLELGMMILTIRLQTTKCLQLLVHIAIYRQKAILQGFEGVTDHTSIHPPMCNIIHFNMCNIWFNQLGMGQVFRSRNLV